MRSLATRQVKRVSEGRTIKKRKRERERGRTRRTWDKVMCEITERREVKNKLGSRKEWAKFIHQYMSNRLNGKSCP